LLEEEMVQRIKSGDKAAFSALMEAYQRKIYSVALGIVRNPEDAMDIAQETFIRAWTKIASWRGDASLSTWLCRIASNLAMDTIRKRKRVLPMADIELSAAENNLEAEVIRAEEKRALDQAIAELPEDYRCLVVLRHTAAMPYQDMADMLGLSLSQVKNRLLRARQMLKTSLSGGYK